MQKTGWQSEAKYEIVVELVGCCSSSLISSGICLRKSCEAINIDQDVFVPPRASFKTAISEWTASRVTINLSGLSYFASFFDPGLTVFDHLVQPFTVNFQAIYTDVFVIGGSKLTLPL